MVGQVIFLHPVVKVAPAAVEGRRAVAEHILCICHTGPTVQAVHVALVLLLAELSFEPLVADTLGHILGGGCIAGYRNADSSILADIVRAWVLRPHKLDVTKCSCVIWWAVTELSAVYCLAGPSIAAGAHTVTDHVVTQFGLTFSSCVSFTKASTFSIVADSFTTISAIYCQAFV